MTKISKRLEFSLEDDTQRYEVKIDNETKKVIYHSSDFSPITLEQIQKLIDKLMRLKMIDLIGDKITDVHICIWNIDNTDDLYIETYHQDEELSDSDRIMSYEEFLNN